MYKPRAYKSYFTVNCMLWRQQTCEHTLKCSLPRHERFQKGSRSKRGVGRHIRNLWVFKTCKHTFPSLRLWSSPCEIQKTNRIKLISWYLTLWLLKDLHFKHTVTWNCDSLRKIVGSVTHAYFFSHTEYHLSATRQCNSTLITTITKILQQEKEKIKKIFLNLIYCCRTNSLFFLFSFLFFFLFWTSKGLEGGKKPLHGLARNKTWIFSCAWKLIP